MSTHTATPWCVLEGDTFGIVDDESRDIALDVCYEDDAAHIVKCVNHHDELVAALKWAVDLHNQLEAAGFVHYDPNMPEHVREIVKARAILAKLDAQS